MAFYFSGGRRIEGWVVTGFFFLILTRKFGGMIIDFDVNRLFVESRFTGF